MKIYCVIGLYAIFTAALIIGFNSGSNLGMSANAVADAYATPMASSQGKQNNLLVIQVDRVNSDQPHLQSVWLMAYYTNSPRVDLLPIFSAPQTAVIDRARKLPELFSLTKSGEPGESFWIEMQKINTWWNAYLLVDSDIFETLKDYLSGDPADKGADATQDSSPTEASLYRTACQVFSQNSGEKSFYPLYFKLKENVRTNLKPGEIREIWQLLQSYGTTLECSFPSLQSP